MTLRYLQENILLIFRRQSLYSLYSCQFFIVSGRQNIYIHVCYIYVHVHTYWTDRKQTKHMSIKQCVWYVVTLSPYFWLLYYCFRSCNKTIQFYLFLTLVYVSTGISLCFYTVLVTNDKWHGCNHQTCFFLLIMITGILALIIINIRLISFSLTVQTA